MPLKKIISSYFCFQLLASCISSHNLQTVSQTDILDPLADGNYFPFALKNTSKNKQIHRSSVNYNHELKAYEYENHQLVKKWIRYFAKKSPERFLRYLHRGSYYKEMIQTVLEDNQLPNHLYYLALIESGFNISARSNASAVGPWQFIKGTGKRFGLKVDSIVDERQDPIRSTLAAAKYLNSLHKVFNSWHLALAAYNSGESRIMNAIIRHGTRDYWKLVELKAIPRETRNYVPKFIAAIVLGENLSKYNLSYSKQNPMPNLKSYKFPSPVSLAKISKHTNIRINVLKKFNPHLTRNTTPYYQRFYRVWIPEEVNLSQAHLLTLKRDPKKSRAWVSNSKSGYRRHRIRTGETLSSIARKFSLSIRDLKRANRISSSRIIAGKIIKIPKLNSSQNIKKYRVRRGDNLFELAKKFGMSIRKLKSLNSMKHSKIFIGQVLKIKSNQG